MAIGDDAAQQGYQIVPDTGENGRVRWGAREINRTRDYIALVKKSIPTAWPVSRGGTGSTTKAGAKTNLGFYSGLYTPTPSLGQNGDIFFRII